VTRGLIASYRLQLGPDFGFDQVREQLPYLRRLGVSHVYLSPITEAREGSPHGYDVTDHNRVRAELGGREGFEALRTAAVEQGLGLILDVVPNHAGVGPHNAAWQDLLAYGPASPHASTFDVDWRPLKPELQGKLLLPFLGRQYGAVLDDDEIAVEYQDHYFHARYYDNRFRLCPASYDRILAEALPGLERQEGYFDLLELQGLYAELRPDEREKALALNQRLAQLVETLGLAPALARLRGERLHALLERQFWRLAYWKTAGDEINYRRFFDVNELVALRMEEPDVFFEAHRLVGELLLEDGVDGLRIDHVDGLVDPHAYLDLLRALGARKVWVEKILAAGETLPEQWPVCGTTGYEFMNDALRLFVHPSGEEPLRQAYRGFVETFVGWEDEVVRSKLLVMETSLAGELTRLAGVLYRLSEADFHTRDFTTAALRRALSGIIASFERYRSYLPHEADAAEEVLRRALADAKRRAENVETSVHEFVFRCLLEPMAEGMEEARKAFVGRFQQYTAPVAAKGVEDTAFYRYVPLVALNEVGGEPDLFRVELQAFHSRARFRQHRYPENLLASATHDHKRGEDTRMRLAALSEFPDEWLETLKRLNERALRSWRESSPLGAPRISQRDAYLLYQHLIALWQDERPPVLAERLREYMRKAIREAKQESSWIDPDAGYESAVEEFVVAMATDGEVAEIVSPLAARLARYGYLNGLAQLALKLTTPGVPDIYQGSELTDLSLVDPDNRRPVDFGTRAALLDEIESTVPLGRVRKWQEQRDQRLKLLLAQRLLTFRREHAELFRSAYRPLESGDETVSGHLVVFVRESDNEQLLVLVPRFMAVLERAGGASMVGGGAWGESALELPPDLAGGEWIDLVTDSRVELGEKAMIAKLPLLPAVLYRTRPE
jgi:(1->4)-alpha-D-glucan 1-alpha-D-glucosylmutase